jgi:hypothetical protein
MLRTLCSQTLEIEGVIDSTVRSEDLAMGYEAHKYLRYTPSIFFFSKRLIRCVPLCGRRSVSTRRFANRLILR